MAKTQTPFLSLSARGSLGNITARHSSSTTTLAKRHGPEYKATPAQITHATLVTQAQLFAHNIPPYPWWTRTEFVDASKNIFHFPSEKHFWMSLVIGQQTTNPALFVGLTTYVPFIDCWCVGYSDWLYSDPLPKFILHTRNTGDPTWIPSEPTFVASWGHTWPYNDALTSTSIEWYVTTENGNPASGVFRNVENVPP